jgi:hypothetical protein
MSTLKVNRIENTSTTDGGLSIDVDGHVTIDGQQLPTEGNSNVNLIHNPHMGWSSRGFANGTGRKGVEACDRWSATWLNDDDFTQKRHILAASDDPYDDGNRHALRITSTGNHTAAGDYCWVQQGISGGDAINFGWRWSNPNSYITVSFWIRSSVSQKYIVTLQAIDPSPDRMYSFETETLVADEWTLVTKTIPGDSSNTQLLRTTAARYYLRFSLFSGGDFTDPSVSFNTWYNYASSARTPDVDNTFGSTAGATVDITGVMINLGSLRGAYKMMPYAEEQQLMALFCRNVAEGIHYAVGMAAYYQNDRAYMTMHLSPRMRGTPTAYIAAGTNTYDLYRNGGADNVNAPVLSNNARPWCVEFLFTGNVGGIAGHAAFVRTDDASCRIYLDADIS